MQGPAGEDPAAAVDDVPEQVRAAFWLLVILLNLSIGALAVGVMLVGFRGQWATGGGLVLVGASALAIAYVRYRTVRRKLDRGELTDRNGSGADPKGDGENDREDSETAEDTD